MNFKEAPKVFPCVGEDLVGVLAIPDTPRDLGVIISVGGPQYRAGSHRQFTLLARKLAASGFAVLRFDFRGMGDSTGKLISFQESGPDIAAAIDTLLGKVPETRSVVLLGLCDAASASLLYWDASGDSRVTGMCLINPWVRSPETLARVHVRHYYLKRLFQANFWKKLLQGRVGVLAAVRELSGKLKTLVFRTSDQSRGGFQHRMAAALSQFPGPVGIVLSGNDHVAKEFEDMAQRGAAWAGILDRSNLDVCHVLEADHTFSSAEWRGAMEKQVIQWLTKIPAGMKHPS